MIISAPPVSSAAPWMRARCATPALSTWFSNSASLAGALVARMPGNDEARDNAHGGHQQCPCQLVRSSSRTAAPRRRRECPAPHSPDPRSRRGPRREIRPELRESLATWARQAGQSWICRATIGLPWARLAQYIIPPAALTTDARSYLFVLRVVLEPRATRGRDEFLRCLPSFRWRPRFRASPCLPRSVAETLYAALRAAVRPRSRWPPPVRSIVPELREIARDRRWHVAATSTGLAVRLARLQN